MPIKDIEKRRESDRERHRKRYRRDKKKILQRQKISRDKRRAHLRQLVINVFGCTCTLCGGQDHRSKHGVSLHEKNGKKHPTHNIERKLKYYLKHPDDFVPLCNSCHLCIERLNRIGISWNEFYEAFKDRLINIREG